VIVIGLLRFVGFLNAAVWFGSLVFFVFLAEPATGSSSMQELLGLRSFPYFSRAICELLASRCFILFLLCALVAMLHTGAEWLYFGKYPKRFWLALIFALFLGGLAQAYGLQPKLQTTLLAQFRPGSRPEEQQAAASSFRSWHLLSTTLNVLLLAGLGVYLWRVANPPDEMRFVGAAHLPGKFRS
jgi:hypothetical protein